MLSEKSASIVESVVSIEESSSRKPQNWVNQIPCSLPISSANDLPVTPVDPSISSSSQKLAEEFGTPMLQPQDFVSRADRSTYFASTNHQYSLANQGTNLFPSLPATLPKTNRSVVSSSSLEICLAAVTTTTHTFSQPVSQPIFRFSAHS